MITRIFIFGEDAVSEFNETGTVPSDEWLDEHGGAVQEVSFKTRAEYEGYMKALDDSDGWGSYDCVDAAPLEEKCPHCQEWQMFFAVRKTDTYCPDCGSLIIPQSQNNPLKQ